MTSLHVALRREQPCKAVVGFSGALLGAEKLPEEINSKPPVCLIHGEEDMVVPFQAMAHAEVGLKAVDVSVETHARPGIDHSIDPDGLKTAIAFIKNQF
jgi:phospholipase/carboxylesterase